MLSRVVLAVVVGVVVALVCMLVGALLKALIVAWAVSIGDFLQHFSGVIGILAALWYFFSGQTWPQQRPRV